MQAPPLPPADTIRRAAEEVVARPYYELDAPPDLRWPLFERAWEFFDRLMSPFQRAFAGLYEASPFLAWLVLIGLLLIAAALVAHIVYSFATAIRMRAAVALPDDDGDDAFDDPGEWERRARDAAGKGEYGAAIRDLLRSCLLSLTTWRGERFRPGSTNREFLRRFASTPAATPLQQLVETFDVIWYGGRAATGEDYELCTSSHAEITAATRSKLDARRT